LGTNKLILSATLNHNPLNIDAYCDSEDQELLNTHPRIILKNNKTQIMEKLEKYQKSFEADEITQDWSVYGQIRPWLGDSKEQVVNEKIFSPIVKALSTYLPLKDFCEDQLPQFDA
jgi:hypothetical protein